MMRRTSINQRQQRVYYNLSYKGDGRMMTGFTTPYRVWMWKQQEVWRQVHEDQFEHYRSMYKRQWFEAFRANSDEYIYKYNITKAHTIKEWEGEMEDQELKRLEEVHKAGARNQLKRKHMDILREYHERHFFHWYERASERLQYFSRMTWVKREDLEEHIERELAKYVRGKDDAYPLNFVGQMPMLEDEDGAIVEVPESLIGMHQAQFSEAMPAQMYEPPETLDADAILREQISGSEEEGEFLSEAEKKAMEEIINHEERIAKPMRVARSEALTDTEQSAEHAARMATKDGRVGSKAASKAHRKGKEAFTIAPDAPSAHGSAEVKAKAATSTGKSHEKKKPKKVVQEEADGKHISHVTGFTDKASTKVGEKVKKVGKLGIDDDQFDNVTTMAKTHAAGGGASGPGSSGSKAGDAGKKKKQSRRKGDDDDDVVQ